MTAQQAFDAQVEHKINAMMPYIVKVAGGDPDLIQEGAIGIWQSMAANPTATDNYHRTRARWNICKRAKGVGRSVDIPKSYPRKNPITLVRFDAPANYGDADLSQAILADRRRVPLDEYVGHNGRFWQKKGSRP